MSVCQFFSPGHTGKWHFLDKAKRQRIFTRKTGQADYFIILCICKHHTVYFKLQPPRKDSLQCPQNILQIIAPGNMPEPQVVKCIKAEIDGGDAEIGHCVKIVCCFDPVCCDMQRANPFYGLQFLQKSQAAFACKRFPAGHPDLVDTKGAEN